jgi:hypothetical protein
MNCFSDGTFTSVAIDGMSMTPDRSDLPSKAADYAFEISDQPWDRRLKCLPLHAITGDSGILFSLKKDYRQLSNPLPNKRNSMSGISSICRSASPIKSKGKSQNSILWTLRTADTKGEPCDAFSSLLKVLGLKDCFVKGLEMLTPRTTCFCFLESEERSGLSILSSNQVETSS